MLLQHRVIKIDALQVVLPGELLSLITDLAERVLCRGARQQLGAAHQRQELRHLFVHCRFHSLHATL